MEKEILNIIAEYRVLPRGNKEHDFKKLNSEKQTEARYTSYKAVLYPALSCLIFIALVGMSFIGVYLYKNDFSDDVKNNEDIVSLSYIDINSLETYNQQNNLNIETGYNANAIYSYKEYSANDEKLCVAISITQWSQELEKALIFAYLSDGRLNGSLYSNLQSKAIYQGVEMNYNLQVDNSGRHCYYIEYVQDGITYQAEIIFSEPTDIEKVFEIIVA